MNILLIDGAPAVGARLAAALREQPNHVDEVVAEAGFIAALDNSYDVALVVVDRISPAVLESALLSLPLPVLVFARELQPDDVVAVLDAGADDVISSPVRLGEIAARLRALGRRVALNASAAIEVGTLKLDTDAHRAWRQTFEIQLSTREFDLLETFMRNPGRVLSRNVLLDSVWDVAFAGSSNVVDQYVGHLRRKIDRPFGTNDLQTVRGSGYRLSAA